MIKSLEDLSNVLKMCRKQGVSSIVADGIAIQFHEQFKKPREAEAVATGEPETDGPTDEQLMFYSAGEPV